MSENSEGYSRSETERRPGEEGLYDADLAEREARAMHGTEAKYSRRLGEASAELVKIGRLETQAGDGFLDEVHRQGREYDARLLHDVDTIDELTGEWESVRERLRDQSLSDEERNKSEQELGFIKERIWGLEILSNKTNITAEVRKGIALSVRSQMCARMLLDEKNA